jgi:hypothetical protein
VRQQQDNHSAKRKSQLQHAPHVDVHGQPLMLGFKHAGIATWLNCAHTMLPAGQVARNKTLGKQSTNLEQPGSHMGWKQTGLTPL